MFRFGENFAVTRSHLRSFEFTLLSRVGRVQQGLLRRGGRRQTASTWRLGGNFPSLGGGDFTKIILMRATVVRPKSGENK